MSQPVILISDGMPPQIETMIASLGWRVVWRSAARDADRQAARAIIHTGAGVLDTADLADLPLLGLIANVSAGYDGVDVAWCRARGIEVSHASGLNADDVADHALGLLIASWRNIVAADRVVRAGGWRNHADLPLPPGLRGRRLGVVGLGAIGQAVAVRAEAFGLMVSWWGPRTKLAPWPRADTLMALAEESDILVVSCRANADNRGLISRDVIDAVGPHGLIVNVARGSLVDEDALQTALRTGRLGRAALDVFEHEPLGPGAWAGFPSVVLTPHSAGHTTDSIPRMLAQAIDNVARFLAGEPVATPVPAAR